MQLQTKSQKSQKARNQKSFLCQIQKGIKQEVQVKKKTHTQKSYTYT